MSACAAIVGLAAAAAPTLAHSAGGPSPIHLEAENGVLTGATVSTNGTGFQGHGFVTNITAPDARIFLKFRAREGLYRLVIRYRSPFGDKGYDAGVNGAKMDGTLPKTNGHEFASVSGGKVELTNGENSLWIGRGWGYFDVDSVDLIPTEPDARPKRVSSRLADPDASREARNLMHHLVANYGRTTLSGQHGIPDYDYVQPAIGVAPAILAEDLSDYSPSRVEHGARPEGHTEAILAKARSGSTISLCWHWNAPMHLKDAMVTDANGKQVDERWYRGFYTDATTFDVAYAMDHPNSPEYHLILRDIDTIAVQLKKLDDAHIPVLWRPLHEASGGWFWWGAKGPEPFKKLWHLMFERLTKKHGIHNLIWVFTADTKSDWYPGDDYVDIVGVDAYPSDYHDPESGTWEQMLKIFDGRKLIALSEFGKVPDIVRMRRYGVYWSYFASWGGDLGARAVPKDELKRLYINPYVTNHP